MNLFNFFAEIQPSVRFSFEDLPTTTTAPQEVERMDSVIDLMEENEDGESQLSFDNLPTTITTTPSEDVEEMDTVIDLIEENEEGDVRLTFDNLSTTTSDDVKGMDIVIDLTKEEDEEEFNVQ